MIALLSTAAIASSESSTHELNWNTTVIYPAINLLILLSILFFLARKPAREFFMSRSQSLAQVIAEKSKAKQEIESLHRDYENRLKNLEQEIQILTASLRQEGELAKEKLIEEAKKAADRLEQTAQWVANQEVKKTKELLKEEVTQQITEKASALLRQKIGSSEHEVIIQENLKQLEQWS